MPAVVVERLLLLRRGVRQDRAGARRGGKEGGRLGEDARVVGVLRLVPLAAGEELAQLAVHDDAQRLRKELHHADMPGLRGEARGPRKQIIARQHGRALVPHCVERRHPAAHERVVDQVVVDQGGVVQHLDRGRHRDDLLGDLIRKQAVRAQRQRGPQPLAAARQQLQEHLGQRRIGPRADGAHLLLDLEKVALYQLEQCHFFDHGFLTPSH
ncbi:MAG: hypothetical protein BWY52_00739 [Chloroflexi bacterium ADurb.Bin325]|nr:MAG: hypothetical protein BWY52_00739 [Chloroflexi bacterium ADurb.Bin325]